MMTFLPYSDFKKSARCLDYKRLGKQRVEAYQILNCLLIKESRWHNHPAVLMWKNHEASLCLYTLAMISEWTNRGYKDSLRMKIWNLYAIAIKKDNKQTVPNWLGTRNFHLSHQSNLVRKFPEHYRKYFPSVPDNLEYYWPSKHS